MPRVLFDALKSSTILPPERGENEERYAINTAKNRSGVRPRMAMPGKTFRAGEDSIQSPVPIRCVRKATQYSRQPAEG